MAKKRKYRLTGAGKALVGGLAAVIVLTSGGVIYASRKNRPATADNADILPTPVSTAFVTTPQPTADSSSDPASTSKPEIILPYSLNVDYKKERYAPITEKNTADDGFVTSWYVSADNGEAYGDLTYEKGSIEIMSGGSSLTDIRMYRDGIPFTGGSTYHLYFSASSSVARTITVLAVDADDGMPVASESFNLNNEEEFHEMTFTYDGANVWNGRIEFQLGGVDQHNITLNSIRLISSDPPLAARVNQLGYQIGSQKRVTFSYNCGDLFDVIEKESGNIVYCGAILNGRDNASTGEYNSYGDFTNLVTPGTYYIRAQNGAVSHEFVIAEDLYGDLQSSLIRMLNIQRCGESTVGPWSGDAGHETCHHAEAKIYGTETTIDVSGGWHDAGDYGRYTKTGVKAVNDLLFAYLSNPGIYTDNDNMSQSGNGIPDILDEARYELEWLLKMQNSDGGVYNTVITTNLPGEIDPSQDDQQLVVLFEETTSTADFAGALATAYLVYQDIDPDFAQKCLDAAGRAVNHFEKNYDSTSIPNPEDVNGGSYMDETDRDGRVFAYMAMWCATGEKNYLDSAIGVANIDLSRTTGVTWKDNGGFGRYLFLTNPNAKKEAPDFYDAMLTSLTQEADGILGQVNGNSYECSLAAYGWGSNADAANNGIILSMAYDFTGRQEYQQAAIEQVNYVLGKNCMNMCFVTGFGTNYPRNIHNRLTASHNIEVSGALVAGSDSYHEDKITENTSWDLPEAVQYYDEYLSYSTNEMAVYYNSALIHLLARIRP